MEVKKSKLMSGLIVLLLASGSLMACGVDQKESATEETSVQPSEKTQGFPRTIKHMMGELPLEEKPERVASVEISVTDYLLVLDVAPVASEGFEGTKSKSPIFAKYAEGKKVADLGSKTNRETLMEMDPQVIVLSGQGKGSSYEEFNKIAPTAALDFSVDARSRLMKVAEIVGKEEKAKQVIADFDKLVNEAKAAAAGHKGEKVLFLISNGKDFTVMHPKNFPIYFEEVGLTPVEGLPEDGKIGGRIGIEALSEFAPDHIFIAENRRKMNQDDPKGLINIWTKHPVWKNLEAVKNNHVYSVDTLVGDTFFLGQIAGLESIKTNLGK
ncbi:ABC transporter substrate-binding protein [Aneurinibacillus migulanus]|uniref:ABC transporter substrate-binding protein n=1 Tax=Aneurinibacillus migulanus TaxID=47500 RepID=A0A0D1VGP7_ANEMI|nr:ABC transporter substrate-binding protein [Aneurinibacillus migulanus]KIV58604.1 ABC transporter substrate-binding protein [Aneurinibacillus migulanus]KON96287.1 ABC transporter substrate-binding protein [Aneurinibacillus migulanus]MED0892203.1 ABC transporter substrate-binding protein [Aneurinibacillus migulanus]SDI25944.1 iron complex transport system substrate-binding protein [Aneurinibacillus migulanus]GED17106.1 ferrichrome ABC transporter substrate-binding protein [Aneurinibacillus mi